MARKLLVAAPATVLLVLGMLSAMFAATANADGCNGWNAGYITCSPVRDDFRDGGFNGRYNDRYDNYHDNREQCPPWMEMRWDNPDDIYRVGGCVDIAQRGYVWCRHNGDKGYRSYLDPPGQDRWPGRDFGPDFWPYWQVGNTY